MASSVKSLPSHYEILGLSPTASQEEINQAFAKNMGMFGARPFAAAAQVSLAFEVLRNPAKRREYDRSIGLAAKPEPYKFTFSMAPQLGAPFAVAATPKNVAQPAPPEPHVTQAEAEAKRAEDKLASLIQSLRDLSEPTVPKAPTQPEPVAEEAPAPQPVVDDAPPMRMPLFVNLELADNQSESAFLRQGWRRPAYVLGALLAGTGILGAVAGLSVTGNNSAAEAEPAVTVAVPAAKKQAPLAVQTVDPAIATDTFPEPQAAPAPEPAHRITRPQLAASRVEIPEVTPEAPVEAAASDPLAPQPEGAPAVAAKLPLPNAVIARTIGRIGYACGSVSSATAVEGSPGSFNVTCTSGNSYRAAPVKGRYRFKRLG
jgi:hypothetical protein